jgi:hypothetical protein
MNFYFWAALVLMTFSAVAFLMQPALRRAYSANDGGSRMPFLVTAVLVPVLAVGMYAYLGSPQAAVAQSAQATGLDKMNQISADRAAQKQTASVSNLVDGLAARLADNPDDAGGWLLLAKSYKHLDRREDARVAYAKAVALGMTDADIDSWLSGGTTASSTAAGSNDDSSEVRIRGRVSLQAAKGSQLDDSATVFIIARESSGPPMPIAVLRTPLSTLPYEFELTDKDSMVAGRELSAMEQVVVTAKLSINGDAMSVEPGYESQSDPVDTKGGEYLELVLGSNPVPEK